MASILSRRRFINLTGISGIALSIPDWVLAGIGKVSSAKVLEASIDVDVNKVIAPIAPEIFGQFIEHLGRAIDGGVYEEGSTLSNAKGYRKDVLEKVQQLRASVLRFPGGTFTKIYHWTDGVGPKKDRHARPNLIWGGVTNNHFGTDEFIDYSRTLNAAPYLAVNMGTGTAEEAANWVEYCNGTRDTYYANMRRKNGNDKPFNVKYWGLGNEESAEPDAGRLQNVKEFTKEAWFYAKLMKLQDPSIKFILPGADDTWNEQLLKDMNPVCDYISTHYYVSTPKRDVPSSLFGLVDGLETQIIKMKKQIADLTPGKVTGFSEWYRFPPRQQAVKISLDELGIWEHEGEGAYHLENAYNWNHALGTATFYNIMLRHADVVGMATWAQTVNVLAPILTSKTASIAQTVFYPMVFYRKHSGDTAIAAIVKTPQIEMKDAKEHAALDVTATINSKDGSLIILVVNRHAEADTKTSLAGISNKYRSATAYELNAASVLAANDIKQPKKNVVTEKEQALSLPLREYTFKAHSITALVFKG
ncbi:hypothetical protein FPZ43_11690 [Mucilaginibacter pallidiroseus]|uniref:non-reducing end alpha-L-arabinofuranosidase n=1 Tax=Mucilaginibacter pallidiroseus TaxID=2599295 RepID=A0A563UC21_9SPHI|nr:alpha-L-arabinofuranosidase C-terminal domain-containing protein [Mucilaginibacter pallidiroseus]TWR28921.1 hypothetical protein FPZ43_11690 [Mucilaginibacter pallidiroseus]